MREMIGKGSVRVLTLLGAFSTGFAIFLEGVEFSDLAKSVFLYAGLLLMGIAAVRAASGAILRRLPRPWFPRQPWRVLSWLRERPSLVLVAPQPPSLAIDDSKGRMDFAALDLILALNGVGDANPAILDLAGADVLLTQASADGQTRRFQFRVEEAGGFLAQPFTRPQSFLVRFVWTGAPAPLADAPDFQQPYRLSLTGARACLQVRGQLRGSLPRIDMVREALPPLQG